MTTLPLPAQDGNPSKFCPSCGRYLPATSEFFHVRKETKSGLASHCKECRNAKQRKAPNAPEGYKRCSLCKETYPSTIEYFSRHQMGKGGLRSRCKSCTSKVNEEYNDRPEVQEHRRAYGEIYLNTPGVKERRHNYHQIYYKIPEKNAQKRVNKHRRRALDKNAPGTYTRKEIQEQYSRQKGKCYYCQQKVIWGKHHIDHVVPLARGGSNDISNLVIACPTCNLRKNDKLPHEWPEGGRLL